MNWHQRYLYQAEWTRELRAYLFERCGYGSAKRVLEIGCGTGAVLGALPTGPALHGVDISPANLKECRRQAATARLVRADAGMLPYRSGVFNVAYCHFLLLWVRNPLEALKEMKRVTASSGYVIAFAEPDYGARQDQPAEMQGLGRLQNQALRRQGAGLRRGTELADLFGKAGIRIIEAGRLQEQPVSPPSTSEWESEWEVLEADLTGLVQPEELAAIKVLDGQAREANAHLLSVPTYFACGQV